MADDDGNGSICVKLCCILL